MIEIARLILAIFTVTFIGYNVLYLLSFEKNRLSKTEKLFISYGLGLGFLSLEMLLFYFFRTNFSIAKIILPWLVLFLINLVICFKNRNKGVAIVAPAEDKDSTALTIFLSIGIGFEVLYAFFRALIKPIESYDAIAIYAIKSKIFFLEKAIPAGFFNGISLIFPHPDYPLNIQLSETFIYLFLGNINDQLVKIIFPLYFVGILAILYFGIRRFAGRNCALLFTFLLASIPQFSAYATNAYIDLPLSYYCFTGTLFLFLWFKNTEDTQFLLLSAVMAGLAAWTKNEGLMYCLINIFLLGTFFTFDGKKTELKNKFLYTIGYVLIISVIYYPWMWIKRSASLVNEAISLVNLNPSNIVNHLNRVIAILYEYQKQFLGPKKWNIIWILFIITLCLKFKKAFFGHAKFITLAVLLAIGGYTFIYIVVPRNFEYQLEGTASRFFIHFLPIVVYWLAYILKDDIKL